MPILVSASQIRKAYSSRPLFDAITFAIESGERIGLIGPNGAGKSTLLKIIASQVAPDDGKISFQKGLTVGYLEQTPQFKPGATIHSALLERASDAEDWEWHEKANELISKLSLGDPSTSIESLSGGWKKRVALARELIRTPDLLLLDEPTNHLDVESILWLEEFLSKSAFAVLTITHDRLFLQRVAKRILELDRRNPGGLLSVNGDYAAYLEVKEQLMSAQEKRETILKNTLRRETEWLRQGAKARTTKQQARIKRAEDLKDEVSELTFRNQTRSARLEFQGLDKNPKKLIEAKKVSKAYGSQLIFSAVDLLITPGVRLGILGPNGCGKSTLIRILLGQEDSTNGEVLRSDQLKVAYFEQNRETLDPELSVMKTICPQGDFVHYRGNKTHIRSYLDRFLFTPGQMEMAVGKLSGGEQSRLLLARLMLEDANVLVLDEPTNDLDIPTLSVLADCLLEFSGAVILVTHDRYFLDQVATQILAYHSNSTKKEWISFADLDQWETWSIQQRTTAADLQTSKSEDLVRKKDSNSNETKPGKKKKLSFKEQRELDSMEENIKKAETELARLTQESMLPENTTNSKRLFEITQDMTKMQAEVDRLYSRWAELESN